MKQNQRRGHVERRGVSPPARGRGLKQGIRIMEMAALRESPPARGRGLKQRTILKQIDAR